MDEIKPLKVLMVPWLAHSHAIPFLELAKRLSKSNFYVYFCSTPIILSFLKQSQSNYFSHTNNIQLIELHLPFNPQLPLENQTTKGLPKHLFPILLNSYKEASPSFLNIVTNLNPDLIIYDLFQDWAPKIASSLRIPAVSYIVVGAATVCFYYHLYVYDGWRDFPFPDIVPPRYELEKLCAQNPSMTKYVDETFAARGVEMSQDIILINNWKCTEIKYMEYFSDLTKKKVIGVGPLIGNTESNEEDSDDDDIVKWLDEKDPFSTLYVAFGSESSLNIEEIEEIARGLELSTVDFIWVVANFPPLGEKNEILPQGFIERVKGRGKIVTKWAPQAKILRHISIGGFLNLCGSNSILESLHFGVPLIAMPIQVDQFIASRYMVELGGGLEVKRNGNGKVKVEKIVKAIKKVMVDKKGKELREKSRELSEKMKREEGKEIDEAIVELHKLCFQQQHTQYIPT